MKGLLREETHKACDESSLGGFTLWNMDGFRPFVSAGNLIRADRV